MKTILKTTAVLGAVLVVAACGRQEPETVSAPAQTPIYAKDGTVVGYRPTVSNSSMSGGMSGDMMSDGNVPQPGSTTDADDEFVDSAGNLNSTLSSAAATGGTGDPQDDGNDNDSD